MMYLKLVWEWIKFILGVITGAFSLIMLVGEADTMELLPASKVIAIAGFIVTYQLFKTN